jgi:NAD(P) transhydrogenase subunit alpha
LDINVNIFGYETSISSLLGLIAIIFATINVVGGYLVTDRMTRMFKKK